jgi:hypothetical protein
LAAQIAERKEDSRSGNARVPFSRLAYIDEHSSSYFNSGRGFFGRHCGATFEEHTCDNENRAENGNDEEWTHGVTSRF